MINLLILWLASLLVALGVGVNRGVRKTRIEHCTRKLGGFLLVKEEKGGDVSFGIKPNQRYPICVGIETDEWGEEHLVVWLWEEGSGEEPSHEVIV